jgi:hypothetical protein
MRWFGVILDNDKSDEYNEYPAHEMSRVKTTRSGRSRLIKYIVIFIVILIIISIIANFYFVYIAARSLNVDPKRIESVEAISLQDYEITFILTMDNPTNTDLKIDQVVYNVYIENDFLGSGKKEGLIIQPGTTDHVFSFKFNLKDLSTVVQNQLLSSSITVFIRGTVTIPIELFNIIKVSEITVDYELSEDIRVI